VLPSSSFAFLRDDAALTPVKLHIEGLMLGNLKLGGSLFSKRGWLTPWEPYASSDVLEVAIESLDLEVSMIS